MKKKEFVKTYDCAPFELYEFAEGAIEVTDCAELAQAGNDFLTAKRNLINMLTKHGVEIG